MKIGERISHLREERRLTQLELARALNISNSALSQYETGARAVSDDLKLRIAAFFDVTLDYLMGQTDIKKAPSHEDADLSEEEQELLSRFRQAPPALQDAAIRVLETDLMREHP